MTIKYSIADNSPHRDKSDYHTSSDTLICNLHQRKRICSLYSQNIEINEIINTIKSAYTKNIKQKEAI